MQTSSTLPQGFKVLHCLYALRSDKETYQSYMPDDLDFPGLAHNSEGWYVYTQECCLSGKSYATANLAVKAWFEEQAQQSTRMLEALAAAASAIPVSFKVLDCTYNWIKGHPDGLQEYCPSDEAWPTMCQRDEKWYAATNFHYPSGTARYDNPESALKAWWQNLATERTEVENRLRDEYIEVGKLTQEFSIFAEAIQIP